MARLEISPTKRGEASERVISALAAEFPKIHTRQSFLKSDSLKRKLGKSAEEHVSEREQRAVAKTLGRLIGDGTIAESLWLRGTDDKVALAATGLIAVSVDITSLRDAWTAWRDCGGEGPEPNQELVVSEIMTRSRLWIGDHTQHGRLPLALTNVGIIHGSNAFDILITAIYREAHGFLQYAREVVQRVPHVSGTHTMQIAQNYGFPDLGAAY